MVSFPPCKINLGLRIIRKRPDGYHDIETCFYPVPWTDILEIIPTEKFSFTASGLSIPGDSDDNLCVRAYSLLKRDFDLPPVAIHLHKIIPTGAGLGGGSSDAAYVLRGLNQLFQLNLSLRQLASYASHLGSDCAFFVYDQAMIGTGRGEILNPADPAISGKFLLLVKPDIHVSTSAAYAGITPQQSAESLDRVISLPLSAWRDHLLNDFEESVFKNFPELAVIKDTLYSQGAIYASMSGSGSTVFGIFDKPVEIKSLSRYTTWGSTL